MQFISQKNKRWIYTKNWKQYNIGTISNILRYIRYTLEYRFLKTTSKPKLFYNVEFKRKSYFLIRIINEILKNGLLNNIVNI